MRLLIAVLLGGLAAALSVTSTGTSATAVTAAGAAHATATSPVPTSVAARIRAEYGQAALLPTFAPASFIYTSWRVDPASPSYLMDALNVTFARNGARLIWSVSDGRDTSSYADCGKKPYFSSSMRIGGKLVYCAKRQPRRLGLDVPDPPRRERLPPTGRR